MTQTNCTACGAVLSPGSAFCVTCGRPVQGAGPIQPPPPPPAPPAGNSISPVLIVLLGLVVAAGGYLFLNGYFTRSEVSSGNTGSPTANANNLAPAPISAPAGAAVEARTWRGTYTCGQGLTGVEVTLRPSGQGTLEGTFSFFPTATNPSAARGCYNVTASVDPNTQRMRTRAGSWVNQPSGYSTVDLDGVVASDQSWAGQVLGGACSSFQVQRAPAAAESCAPAARGPEGSGQSAGGSAGSRPSVNSMPRTAQITQCMDEMRRDSPPGSDLAGFCSCAVDGLIAGGERDGVARRCAAQVGMPSPR